MGVRPAGGGGAICSCFGAEPLPLGGEAPSNVDLVMSVCVFTLIPKGSGHSLTAGCAPFPRPQPRLHLFLGGEGSGCGPAAWPEDCVVRWEPEGAGERMSHRPSCTASNMCITVYITVLRDVGDTGHQVGYRSL